MAASGNLAGSLAKNAASAKGLDRRGVLPMARDPEGRGLTAVPLREGLKDMSPKAKELMKLTPEQKTAHGGHRVPRRDRDNICIRTDPAGNIKKNEEKSTGKIDEATAASMVLGRSGRRGDDTGASVYDKRGLLFI